MKDNRCIHFLQWALPRLNMRWPGFRKVRGQVCKRLYRRLSELGLEGIDSYKEFLEMHSEEWAVLDQMCRITISRFYRDRVVFNYFFGDVLPEIIARKKGKENIIRVWSAGCASGEEPYTIAIGWQYLVGPNHPELKLEVLATDIDPVILQRAKAAIYPWSSIRNLPDKWREMAFLQKKNEFLLETSLKGGVRYELLDIRSEVPDSSFQVIFCRNLAFTYFDLELQHRVLQSMEKVLEPGGVLVTGCQEKIILTGTELIQWVEHMPIYQKIH